MSAPGRPKWLYNTIYLALSGIAFYHMRLGPSSQLTGTHLEPLLTGNTQFTYPGHPEIILRKHYTGIAVIDGLLSMLVAAFLAGPAKFKEYILVQQVNFLVTFTPVLLFFSIESIRGRNRWSPIVSTSFWSLLYQTVGGAVVIPLYFIAHSWTFSGPSSTRPTPTNWSSTMLPAILLGYLLPTGMMYYPYKNLDHTMLATAFWQPSPLLVNLLWAIFALFTSKTKSTTAKTASKHFGQSSIVIGTIAAICHITTLYACFSADHPTVTLKSIFVPIENAKGAFEDAVHFIFQIDYLIVFLATTVFCVQKRSERRAVGKAGSVIMDVAILGLSTVVVGPGATLALTACRPERQGVAGTAVKVE